MARLSIGAVMAAMAAVAEAQKEEAEARAEAGDPISWDYFGSRYLNAVSDAEAEAEKVLQEYIAQEVQDQVHALRQAWR